MVIKSTQFGLKGCIYTSHISVRIEGYLSVFIVWSWVEEESYISVWVSTYLAKKLKVIAVQRSVTTTERDLGLGLRGCRKKVVKESLGDQG